MFGHQLYSAASILGENMLIQFNYLQQRTNNETGLSTLAATLADVSSLLLRGISRLLAQQCHTLGYAGLLHARNTFGPAAT